VKIENITRWRQSDCASLAAAPPTRYGRKKMENTTSGSIRFTVEEVQELDGNQIVVSVPRKEITSISLCYGEGVERPILQFIAGMITCALGFVIGVYPIVGMFSGETVGEPIAVKPFAFAAPLIFIGVAVIIPIFRRSHYLLVITKNDRRKLTIRNASQVEVMNSAQSAGYEMCGANELKP
jgi:hypothetical protein